MVYGSYTVKQLTTSKDTTKVDDFNLDVRESGSKIYYTISNAKITAIHAGLECGCLSAKMKQKGKKLVACSIGPNISGAHTINERCEIKSAQIIAQVVRDVLKNA